MAWALRKGLNGWEIWNENEKQDDRPLRFLSHRIRIPAQFASLADLEAWLMETEKKQAKNAVLYLLSRQNYPSQRLSRKLHQKGYSALVIEEIIAWVQGLGIVQDQEYLRRAIERESGKGHGPQSTIWKLRQKGFSEEAIEKELSQIMPIEIQKEAIRKFLLKRPLTGPLAKQKIMAALVRRGFSFNLINDVIREK